MSDYMIMKAVPVLPIRRGFGDPISDAANALLAPLTQQIDAKVNASKVQVLAEVQKQGREAKIVAVAGGFAAGLVGAYLFRRFF